MIRISTSVPARPICFPRSLRRGEPRVRVLVLYAHPVETSFVSALHEAAVETLRAGGHEVDDCDLNREGFDPVLSRQGRLDYHDVGRNRAGIEDHVRRLKAAEGLVLVHPIWNYGFPAILKGYVDRVFLPGVAFDIDAAGNLEFTLRHIRRLAAVCTYGGGRWRTWLAGDPPKHVFKRPCDARCPAPPRATTWRCTT